VNKPELVIESNPDDDFVHGVCSSCPQVRFRLTGNTLEQKTLVRRMFDNHFRKFHMQKDASQAKDEAK
jgi:hypothetical protein